MMQTIYGEAVFTPDGPEIGNAAHWPRLWDPRSGRLVAPQAANREISTFRPITFDPSRDAILMGSQDGRVYAWHLKTKLRIAVSPPQLGRDVQLWNPDTGQRRSLPAAARPASSLVLGPAGTSIIFGTLDGTVEFWNIRSEQRIRTLKIPAA